MACPIIWCAFSWEAFSTLVTGMLAVGGAVYIGRKQVGISKKQTEILGQQASIQEQTLRFSLFDRRYKIYNCARDILGVISEKQHMISVDKLHDFNLFSGESEFLFTDIKVRKTLDEITKKCVLYQSDMMVSSNGNQTRLAATAQWALAQQNDIYKVFHELRLSPESAC